jgi:hypothetical protein
MQRNSLVKDFLFMRWLWEIFAGFYLVAYTFWVPKLFSDILVIVLLGGLTLLVGLVLLYLGFQRALELDKRRVLPMIPKVRLWWLIGGILLLGYISVYIPPSGRIVAHWPLDLAITVVSGFIMLGYATILRRG